MEDYEAASRIQGDIINVKGELTRKLDSIGFTIQEDGNLIKNENYANPVFKVPLKKFATGRHNQVAQESELVVQDSTESLNSIQLDSLTEEQCEVFAQTVSAFGLTTTARTLSNHWNFRKMGLEAILGALDTTDNLSRDLPAFFEILEIALEDSREQSNKLTFSIYSKIIDCLEPSGIEPSFSFPFIKKTIPTLLSKAGEMNPRIQKASLDLIESVCKQFHSTPASVLPLLLKSEPGKQLDQMPWKLIKTRLEIISILVEKYGIEDGLLTHSTGWNSRVLLVLT